MERWEPGDGAGTRAAVVGRAFRLEFQPIVHLDTGELAGLEALCRFDDGCPPEVRFAEAERLGLAPALDLAIIERAVGPGAVVPCGYLAVNVSPATIRDPRLSEVLRSGRIPPERLVVEVTERAEVADYDEAQHVLGALRQAGIRLAVDDAGAGYANFRHILSLHPDIIKMDQSITRHIDTDPARRALATALVIFAGQVGAVVIAEGVETLGELRALQAAGIQRAQGYALGPPSPTPLADLQYRAPADQPVPEPDMLLWAHVDSTVAVTAHGLLGAANAIEGALGLLRQRRQSITDEEYRALVGTAERQARHIGGVLRDLVRGLPGESVAVLDGLVQGELPTR